MATGTWSETQKPSIPGMYNRFKWAAENTLTQGINGIVGMPVKADWGPVKQITSVTSTPELKNKFGSNMDLTAYKLGRLTLLGQPKELLLYRLADSNAKVASITLKDTAGTPVDVIRLDTLYPTTRKFNVSIKPNIVDESIFDMTLYESTEQIYVFKVSGSIEDIVNAINNNEENLWIKAEKVADGSGLANIVSQPFAGGDNGTTNITNQDYMDAMSILEGYKIDGFNLDGVSDAALQAAVQAWIDKSNKNGAGIISVLGGKGKEDIDIINTQSKSFNDMSISNVGVSGTYEGIEYSPAEVACYITGLAVGKGIKESIVNQKTIFEDVSPRLSRDQVESCLAAGTLVLVNENQDIIVVDDVNTLKKFSDGQSEALGYIRAVKFLYTVDSDTTLQRTNFIGQLVNDDTGQKVVISALKKYFETLQNNGVISEFDVEVDKELQANAKSDEFYWKWNATYVNIMKKIFGTGYVQ
ncbi:phage tail sheath family protein [Clostridium tyrobutyricum]|uniref:phage tail sheath family protein n=1 Tax=Clostridium tyrobutyricum TaxID=1519 RepID=UPI001C3958D0|nr:phage tail sheath family protein [Clostridium tyrobutyricum]MBV4447439.1 phage tail sheath family protein [Clostridium tyrobutyricum]